MRISHKSTNQNILGLIFLMGGKNAFTYSGEMREENFIKQEEIAKILNVNQSTYSRYESRKFGNSYFSSF